MNYIIFIEIHKSVARFSALIFALIIFAEPAQSQYYDLTVGTERHFDSESHLDVFTRVATSEYSAWGVERVIDEQVIDETTWAVVEWLQWNWHYQPSGTYLILNRDTVLFRLSGSTLIQLQNGESRPVFDFDFAIGDSMYAKTKTYLADWQRNLFDDLGDVGGTVLLDADILFPDENTYRILWGDGSSSGQFEHPIPSAEVFLNEIISEKDGWLYPYNPTKTALYTPILPFFYVEGIGSLYNIFNHRGLYMSGYKSATGDVMGQLHSVPVSINQLNPQTPTETPVLYQNYPNPFNPVTTLSFHLPQPVSVRLTVHDILGREISVLLDGMLPEGGHHTSWDGSGLPSGTYLLRLRAGNWYGMQKILLMK